VCEVYYYWLGTKSPAFGSRIRSRDAIFTKLQSTWESSTPSEIAKGFDPAYPYALFHIVFTADYETPASVPKNSAIDWKWLSSVLLEMLH